MHIPDGFLDLPTCIAGGVLAAGLVAWSVRRTAATLDDRQVPLAGLVAAVVFALQMLNFPVAGGTSGHLLGGTLAAVLVGPWLGGLAMAVVFGVQALVFADGGLTALGWNVVIMGYVTCFVGYGVFRALRWVLPRSRVGALTATAVAAWASVVVASGAFVLAYAIGGTADVGVGTVAVAMVGVHALIGIGEAVLTALVVGAVLAARPDLAFGAQDLRRPVAPPAVGATS